MSSCEGPHSLISELTRGAAVGPQIYKDCNGCLRGAAKLEPRHLIAMAELDVASLRTVDTSDVKPVQLAVEEAGEAAADPLAALAAAPFCSATKRSRSGRC